MKPLSFPKGSRFFSPSANGTVLTGQSLTLDLVGRDLSTWAFDRLLLSCQYPRAVYLTLRDKKTSKVLLPRTLVQTARNLFDNHRLLRPFVMPKNHTLEAYFENTGGTDSTVGIVCPGYDEDVVRHMRKEGLLSKSPQLFGAQVLPVISETSQQFQVETKERDVQVVRFAISDEDTDTSMRYQVYDGYDWTDPLTENELQRLFDRFRARPGFDVKALAVLTLKVTGDALAARTVSTLFEAYPA